MLSRFILAAVSRYSPGDILAAFAPLLGSVGVRLTLADVNTAVQILGGCAGFAYLLWKWRREAKTPPDAPASHA